MADTRYLKTKVEEYVREQLKNEFGEPFSKVFLPLVDIQGEPRTHEFDAVSSDRTIVCSIKTASWKTSGLKRGSGKVQGAYAELYFLDHVQAEQRLLILTDPEFLECFARETHGRLARGIALRGCTLPDELCREIACIRAKSRSELGFNGLGPS